MFNSSNVKQFTLTNFFSSKFNSRASRAPLDQTKRVLNVNEAAKVSSLAAHNRLGSCASTDSAFFDDHSQNANNLTGYNLRAFKTKFDNLKEADSDDLKSVNSINHTGLTKSDLKRELM